MSVAIPSPANCCDPCESTTTQGPPGPQGQPGTNGTNGTNGSNAYTTLTALFTQPAASATAIASVASSDWAAVGQDVFLEGGGYYVVTAIPDSTHITLQNLGYDANSAPGTIIAIGSQLSPAGPKGEDGTPGGGGGDMLGANNLSDVDSADASLTNLGGSVVGKNIFKAADPSAIRFIRINANNTVTLLTEADQRTALGLEPGVDVQAYDDELAAIAALVSAADKLPYFTGSGTASLADLTSFGRTLIAASNAAAVQSALKVLPRYGLLGSATAADLNVAGGDTSIAMASSRYRIDRITLENESINATTATAGVFTAPVAGGTTIVADGGVALSTPNKFLDMILSAAPTFDVLTNAVLYFHVGTAEGSPATVNVWIFGWDFAP